jgi:glycosyltransferase involved in cell wall biosynthesis
VEFEPTPPSLRGKAVNVGRMVWSTAAARGIDEVLSAFDPDVVHLHNVYHQLSPSILRPIARRGLPAVMTLHDYKLACPTYRFLDHGTLCEACVPHRFWNAGLRACNGSRAASAMAGLELGLHTITGAYRPVGRFVCPSRFLGAKMRAAKVFPDRLRWLPNFVDVGRWRTKDAPGTGAIVAGRLSEEKGVDVAVRAVAQLETASLDVAGDGPARASLEALADELGVRDRVRFHGRLATTELETLLRRAAVALVPSRWYENQPLAVLEAFACGLPVIGTDLGGIPELIEPGVDGARVPPDDPEALAQALGPLLREPEIAFTMGKAGRAKVERDHAPAQHLEGLLRIYDEARRAAVAA